MDEIKWLEVAVNTTPDRLDEVTAKLTAAGMTGLVIEDEGEFQQFLEQNRQYWDYVDQELMDRMRGVTRVKFYVTDDGAGRVQLEQYTRGLDAEYTVTPLTDNDWAYSWQKYYKPLEVGRRLYVVPEWMRDEPVPEGRSPLYLNPGLTFGTGSHASTQLCLEGVEEHTLTGRPVLDLGCGSGILSIAALCLGASTAAAVDIDPKAVDVAYENAALNGIGRDRYTVRAGDILSDRALAAQLACQRYHLVLANIVADVIIPLSAQVPALLAEDGVFLCSGIIDTRAHEVEEALVRQGLTLTGRREKNGWVALEARCPAAGGWRHMVFLCPIWTYLGLPNDLFAEMHRKSSTLEQVELFPSLYLTCMLQTSKGTYQHTDDENLVCTFSIQASPKIKTRQLTSAARFLQRQLLQGQYRSNKLQCLHS